MDSCCRAIARSGCGLPPENRSAISPALSPASTSALSATITSIIFPSTATAITTVFPAWASTRIGARSFGKLLGEYNLPPKRFRELGTTWAYVNWARLTLFSSGLFTNFTSDASRGYYANIGTQLDLRVVLFTYLNATLSGGYAAAADRNGHVTTEYMVSLRIL